MGWEVKAAAITATVSLHNSDQDYLDDKSWTEFIDRVKQLAEGMPDHMNVMVY